MHRDSLTMRQLLESSLMQEDSLQQEKKRLLMVRLSLHRVTRTITQLLATLQR